MSDWRDQQFYIADKGGLFVLPVGVAEELAAERDRLRDERDELQSAFDDVADKYVGQGRDLEAAQRRIGEAEGLLDKFDAAIAAERKTALRGDAINWQWSTDAALLNVRRALASGAGDQGEDG